MPALVGKAGLWDSQALCFRLSSATSWLVLLGKSLDLSEPFPHL